MRRDESLVLPIQLLSNASATQLRNAITGWGTRFNTPRQIYFSVAPWEEFDPETSLVEDLSLTIDAFDDEFNLEAYFSLAPGEPFEEDRWRTLVGPLLDDLGAAWNGSWTDDDYGPGLVVSLVARFSARGRSVGELFDAATQFQQLVWAATGKAELSASRVAQLVRGGYASALVGQPENSWIDVKEQPYSLRTTQQKLELAKDVAAFANTGSEAVIFIGFRTKQGINGEVIDQPRPFPSKAMNVQAMLDSLNGWIVPPLLDVEVEVIELTAERSFGLIRIPAQDPSALPVMVAGAILDGNLVGTHLTIPLRAGDRTVYADVARVHSLIAAGRAALSGEAQIAGD